MARALLQDAPVLVLDEPTTGLDAEAAQRLVAPLRGLMRDRATLLITHDLALAAEADEVASVAAADGRVDARSCEPGMIADGECLAPGYSVIEHLSRTRRLDTYEVWSDERACSCVAKTLRPDRRDDERARAALLAEGGC